MITKFIEWLKKQIGSVYVWGGQGEVAFNEDWIRKMETSDKNADRAIAFYNKQQRLGLDPIAAYDCSGLIVRFLIDNNIIQNDMSASGLYAIGSKLLRDEIKAGDLVFRHNGTCIHHVGVYIGDGMVIHAKGRDVGVVMEHLETNGEEYWNRYARIKGLEKKAEEHFPRLMTYSGATYVNLRSVPGAASSGTVIDKVSKDEEVLVLGISSGWADIVKYCEGDTYKRGFCISKYLKDAS